MKGHLKGRSLGDSTVHRFSPVGLPALLSSYRAGVGRFALAVALVGIAVALVAAIDHRHKREVEFAAQEDAWFCAHGRPSRCTDFDEAAYEQRWEDREFGYRLAVFTLGTAAIGSALVWFRRRTPPHDHG
jgi:hypothetical protein